MYLDERGIVQEMQSIVVWTNGSAIRKYQGQEKMKTVDHSEENGWFKAEILIVKGGVEKNGRIEYNEKDTATE